MQAFTDWASAPQHWMRLFLAMVSIVTERAATLNIRASTFNVEATTASRPHKPRPGRQRATSRFLPLTQTAIVVSTLHSRPNKQASRPVSSHPPAPITRRGGNAGRRSSSLEAAIHNNANAPLALSSDVPGRLDTALDAI
ncbi:hypothetical protein VB005_03484 [Metarhizium brunneum]